MIYQVQASEWTAGESGNHLLKLQGQLNSLRETRYDLHEIIPIVIPNSKPGFPAKVLLLIVSKTDDPAFDQS